VSTVGIVPRMEELFARTKAQVAVSLHAVDPAQRRALLPVARKWSLPELRDCIAKAPRTVLLQWTLIEEPTTPTRTRTRSPDSAPDSTCA